MNGSASASSVSFTVYGDAKPAGSKKAFVNPKTGKAIVTDSSGKKGREWRQDVKQAAREAMNGQSLLEGPLKLDICFYRARPKGHWRTGRNSHLLRDSAPRHPITRPDLTKTLRSVEDALSGTVFADDAQIVTQEIRKRYVDGEPRCEIEVKPLPPVDLGLTEET